MKPIHVFFAAFIMLGFMGLSFNWTAGDRPAIVEVLGVIGTFTWLPLMIGAGVWARRLSKRER